MIATHITGMTRILEKAGVDPIVAMETLEEYWYDRDAIVIEADTIANWFNLDKQQARVVIYNVLKNYTLGDRLSYEDFEAVANELY